MALSEFERKKVDVETTRFIESIRPPEDIRDQLDIGFNIHNQSVTIFEIRPHWDKPTEKMELPVAKTTYTKASGIWKIYWMRADLKWHGYTPRPAVKQLTDFFKVVADDEDGCFWG